MTESEESGNVHTSPEEGHPAGESDRSDREIGGPTSGEDSGDESGGAPGTGSESAPDLDTHK